MDLEESSASLRIWYLEFYLPLYSMDLLTLLPSLSPSITLSFSPSLSLFLPAVLFNPLSFSFFSAWRSACTLTRTTQIALLGISEVLSRIQRLHRPSWMDRQSSLTLRPLLPSTVAFSFSFSLVCSSLSNTYVYILSFPLSLALPTYTLSVYVSPSVLPPFFFLWVYPTTRCEIIPRLDTREKFTDSTCARTYLPTYPARSYSKFPGIFHLFTGFRQFLNSERYIYAYILAIISRLAVIDLIKCTECLGSSTLIIDIIMVEV